MEIVMDTFCGLTLELAELVCGKPYGPSKADVEIIKQTNSQMMDKVSWRSVCAQLHGLVVVNTLAALSHGHEEIASKIMDIADRAWKLECEMKEMKS